MKQCPQCEFLYEDDQSVCDMDGKELVYDGDPPSFQITPALTSTYLQESVTAKNALAEGAAVGLASSLATGGQSAVEWTPLGNVPESNVVESTMCEQGNALAVSEAVMKKATPEWRRIAVVALVGLLLGMLAFLVYYVSSRRPNAKFETQNIKSDPLRQSAAQSNSASSAPNTNESLAKPAVASEPLNEDVEPGMTASQSERNSIVERAAGPTSATAVDKRFPVLRPLPPLPRVRPLPRLPAAKVEDTKSASSASGLKPISTSKNTINANAKTAAVNQQRDSKVGSFLKRTGRILKKPFRF